MRLVDGKTGRWGIITRGLALPCALFLGACGDDHDGKAKAGQPHETAEGALKFASCPTDLPGQKLGRECATASVPLHWDEPEGESIELLVARYRGNTPSRGQLWLLDGGPGGTGAIYMDPSILPLYASLGLDVYVPQHRGTGHSTPLNCDEATDIPSCGAALVDTWGDGLSGFNSVEAGRDVGFLVEQAHAESEPAFVFGLSYGSYWAQRYLQAFPKQASGVILEGVFPLSADLSQGDPIADTAARSLFEACRNEPDCAAAFGDEDPEDVARRVVSDASDPAKRCLGADGADPSELELVLTGLIVSDLGTFVPGVMRRLDRCNEQDQQELTAMAELLVSAFSMDADPSVDNVPLGLHVIRTDLLAGLSTFPLEERLAAREPLIFWSGAASTEEFAAIVDGWPVNYPPAAKALPAAHSPVLLLNGGLDIQTPSPWARELASTLGGQLVEFPFAGHGVDISLASPLTLGDASCSLGMLQSFVDDPSAPVDGACAPTAYTPDLAGKGDITQQVAAQLYGADTPVMGADDAGAPRTKRGLAPGSALSRDALVATIRARVREAPGFAAR